MSLTNIAEAAASRFFYRLALYEVFGLFGAIFALFALYNFTIAGMAALEPEFGVVYARLIIAGIYTALTMGSVGILWFLASKARKFGPAFEAAPKPASRHIQLAVLLEALLLGFEAAKKARHVR
jgi:hypothetical protein